MYYDTICLLFIILPCWQCFCGAAAADLWKGRCSWNGHDAHAFAWWEDWICHVSAISLIAGVSDICFTHGLCLSRFRCLGNSLECSHTPHHHSKEAAVAVAEAEVQVGEDVAMVMTAGGGVAVIILIDSDLNWLLVSVVVEEHELCSLWIYLWIVGVSVILYWIYHEKWTCQRQLMQKCSSVHNLSFFPFNSFQILR